MSEILVTAAQLKAKADELNNLRNQYKNQIDKLTQTENALNGMWEGEARKTFHTAFTADQTHFHEFEKVVQQYAQVLDQIVKKYEQSEAKNVQIAQSK
ncbi:WXG100 family type VII secretion target [Lachnospiraceae bacterium KH1T2]|nr:WXG100 family type VII secretion target [Lachnospiraceae bacterium KH1T2]